MEIKTNCCSNWNLAEQIKKQKTYWLSLAPQTAHSNRKSSQDSTQAYSDYTHPYYSSYISEIKYDTGTFYGEYDFVGVTITWYDVN